ncbi:MAG: TIGR04066 family peptide maturation system protein [Lachnospiraceae bacterium]|nr:TIGR04066 family peptide maturation system protein [Lachnospiraceae bacterium]
MEKLLIYNFDKNSSALARYDSLLTEYIPFKYIVAESAGLDGKDASVVDGGSFLNKPLTVNYKESLDVCDAVLFNYCDFRYINHKLLIKEIDQAVNQKKKIILSKDIEKYIKSNEDFPEFTYRSLGSDTKYQFDKRAKMGRINTPIVFILGLGQYCNKFEILLTFKKYLEQMGYKPLCISGNPYSELFGIRSIPEFMFANEVSDTEKITNLNNYFRNWEQEEEPDIFLVSVPDAILPFNMDYHNNFGTLPFIFANALNPDIEILSVYSAVYSDYYYCNMKNICKYRLNCDSVYFHMAGSELKYEPLISREEPKVSIVQMKNVMKKLEDKTARKYRVFNVMDENSANNIYDRIIEELSNNLLVI